MGLKESLERMRVLFDGTSLDSRLPPHYPQTAIEIDADRITGIRLGLDRKSRKLQVRKTVVRDLPPGCIEASFSRPNVLDMETAGLAVDEVLRGLGPGEHRVSLLLPDHVARVTLLSFTSLPATRRELFDVVRFRMAKSLPFKAEDSAMDVMQVGGPAAVGAGAGAAASVLAVFMYRPALEQYETLLTSRGYWPGLVGLSTLELFNLFRERLEPGLHERDLLLMNLTRRYLTLVILSQGQILFYRCKPHAAGFEPEGEFQGVRREIYTSLAFYSEKLLGRGLGRVVLRAVGVPQDKVIEAVRSEAGCPVEPLSLGDVLSPAEGVSLDAETSGLIAPAAGAAAGRRP